ncbi:hypothetical protein ISCGN_000940 [Ixodes scapularis]
MAANVAAEEAIDDTLWRYSQQLYNKVPDFFLNSEDIYCRFRSLRAIYDNVNSSLSDPCTGGRPGIACWAIRERLRLNTLLNPYGAELAHVTPNVFCFRTLPSSAVAVFSKEFHLTGVYLVLWLLSEHRCITSVSLRASIVASNAVPLFYKLFELHPFYTHVKIDLSLEVLGYDFSEDIMRTLRELRSLESLELTAFDFRGKAGESLCLLLKQNGEMRVLSLLNDSIDVTSARTVMRWVSGIPVLKKVRLGLFPTSDYSAFAGLVAMPLMSGYLREVTIDVECRTENLFEALRSNTTLLKLSVLRPTCSIDSLRTLAFSMSNNTTLKFLKIVIDLDVLSPNGLHWRCLADVVRTNTGLTELDLRASGLNDEFAVELSGALVANSTLLKIRLEDNLFTTTGAHSLLDGLEFNAVVAEVRLGSIEGENYHKARLLTRIIRTGNSRRLRIHYEEGDFPSLSDALRSNHSVPEIQISCYVTHRQPMEHLFRSFIFSRDHLTILHLSLTTTIDLYCAHYLSLLFLRSTALRSAVLNFRTPSLASAILLGGLALNKTITRLNLDEWEFEAFAAEVLAEMLTRNRALHHISIRLRTRTEAWFIRSSLMRGIASNFSLLTLELQYGQERCSVVVCEVLHVLRRNELMLNRAVDFVANRNGGWTAAFAFQTLEKCYSLVDKLVGLYGCTSGEARNRIDVAVLFVHTQFFQLVTVSRGPLMCLDAPRGQRTQIDALPPECLSAIASFLNLEDVFVQERRLPFPLQFSLA